MVKRLVSIALSALLILILASCTRPHGQPEVTTVHEMGGDTKNEEISDDPSEGDKNTEADSGDIEKAPVADTEKTPVKINRKDGKVVVCIDPGHGFGDVGCSTPYLDGYEKDVTLKLSEALAKELENNGATVVFTHDGNSFPSLDEIKTEADRYGVEYDEAKMDDNDIFGKYERAVWQNVLDKKYTLDMFISLHVNTIEGYPDIEGASVDYCINNPYRYMLADFCESLEEAFTENGVSKSVTIFEDEMDMAYTVTKYSTAPSVLIEAGYGTCPAEAARINSESWREKFAQVLCETVLQYCE